MLFDSNNFELKLLNYNELSIHLIKKQKLYIFLLFPIFILSCDLDSINTSTTTQIGNQIKIYSGSYGYEVAYRVDGNKIYSGNYGYEIAYRIDGSKIYSGTYGYTTAYRIDGDKIYSGSYGYETAYRIDGDKVYSGSYGYNVAYRIDR